VIHEQMVDEPSHVEMLLKEARLAATLDHPGIVQVFDVGADKDEHYLTMEYVHGRDLRQVLRELAGRDRMPLLLAIAIVHEIARALHYAHTRKDNAGHPLGIVHRDVSPSNIIVSFGGAVKLTDFGIAKVTAHTAVTRTGTFKGKFGYMSPEQYLQQDVDARSDVFSLGIVLYELTTGRRAFAGENPFAAMNKAVDGIYTAPHTLVPDYPPALGDIVAHALAPDRDARYADAASMADDLDRLARALGGPAPRAALEEFVAELFGRPEPPDASHVGVLPTVVTSSMPTRSPRRPMPLFVVGAAAIVAGALGWGAGRAAEPEHREPVAPVVDAPLAAAPLAASTPARAVPATPPQRPEPARVEPTRASASTAAASTRSRTSAKKRKKPEAPATETSSRLDSLLPPSAKSQ
jgi:serine/threonine protein kinase